MCLAPGTFPLFYRKKWYVYYLCMEIDPNIATDIVTHLKDALRHEINFFNTSGIIIASTDPTRIGSGHDGARLAIASKQTVCVDDEHRFAGARNGINVPVQFDGEPVAVIGITGERDEVEPFGTVLQKMTEILIREHLDQLARFNRRTMRDSLITALAYGSGNVADNERLAAMLGIDLDLPCMIASIRGVNPHDLLTYQERIVSALDRQVEGRPDVLATLTPQECLLVIVGSDDETAESTIRATESLFRRSPGMPRTVVSAAGHPPCMIVGVATIRPWPRCAGASRPMLRHCRHPMNVIMPRPVHGSHQRSFNIAMTKTRVSRLSPDTRTSTWGS